VLLTDGGEEVLSVDVIPEPLLGKGVGVDEGRLNEMLDRGLGDDTAWVVVRHSSESVLGEGDAGHQGEHFEGGTHGF